ncbi:MAG: hypothetical protein CME60_05570 [Halobacteriovoraceae bacterium]|nr:hypothetical protein [Halobacteriovoraceae bacterium]
MKKLLIALLISLNTYSSPYSIKDAQVEFQAKGFPSFININGKTQELNGTFSYDPKMKEIKDLSLTVPLATLKTGMELRDEHMTTKYLETDKFPHAEIIIDKLNPKAEGKVNATLKLHGKSREIIVEYKRVSLSQENITFNCQFSIDLSDYAIVTPSFQGISVAKDVKVSVDFTAHNQK